jgi:hypothetical protein
MGRGGLALGLVALAGCGAGVPPPTYQDGEGFRITAPPGWVERARSDALPGATHGRRRPAIPLPPLAGPGQPTPERLLVRYDRVRAGRLAWLRVSAADLPASSPLAGCLSPPGADWRREGEVEALEVGGLPASRAAFRGAWEGQDYLCETVAVRRGGRVYLLAAAFPAADAGAREEVRQAAAGASWR